MSLRRLVADDCFQPLELVCFTTEFGSGGSGRLEVPMVELQSRGQILFAALRRGAMQPAHVAELVEQPPFQCQISITAPGRSTHVNETIPAAGTSHHSLLTQACDQWQSALPEFWHRPVRTC